MFIDTHCHLSREDYDDIDKVIEEDKEAGVARIVVSGFSRETLRKIPSDDR